MAEIIIKGESKTFEEKVALLQGERADYLKDVQAALNAKCKVHERISKKYATYNRGRDAVARISIIGQTVRVHLAVNAADYEGKQSFKVVDKKAYEKVPVMIKLTSKLAVKRAIEAIESI